MSVARRVPLLVFLACCPPAPGKELLPGFYLDSCAWHATHVAVVTEGRRIDGDVEVVYSWKGGLRKGERLSLPGLAEFADPQRRAINVEAPGGAAGGPAEVTGSLIIVFLTRVPEKADPSKGTWAPACPAWSEMSGSAVWLEQGDAYAVVIRSEKGPGQIWSLGKTEAEVRRRVERFAAVREELDAAAASPDPDRRAERLIALARSDVYLARGAAFKALGEGGKGVLPALRRMLANPALAPSHADAVRALATAGGEAAGPDLVKVLEGELRFWKGVGPGLRVGWWNGAGLGEDERGRLQDRYSVALQALYGMRGQLPEGGRKVVTEFRDFWRSLPQLEDKSGLTQMSEECDRVLGRAGR
jgi:hypothetical protein